MELKIWNGKKSTYFPGKDRTDEEDLSVRTSNARALYKAGKPVHFPTCHNTTDTELTAAPKQPDCECCETGAYKICDNNLLIWAIIFMCLGWASIVTHDGVMSDTNVLGALGQWGKSDETDDSSVTAWTNRLVTGMPSFEFTSRCYHTETTGSGKIGVPKRW